MRSSPSHSKARRLACAALLAVVIARPVGAADLGSAGVGSTQLRPSDRSGVSASSSSPGARAHGQSLWLQGAGDDQTLAQAWRITVPELRRARELMAGPRGAFSDPAISPVEVLGIHATSPGERQRYARLVARISADDTVQLLAWFSALRKESAAVAATLPQMPASAAPSAAMVPPTRATAMGPVANNRSPAETAVRSSAPARRTP